jgi:hypothetical protein
MKKLNIVEKETARLVATILTMDTDRVNIMDYSTGIQMEVMNILKSTSPKEYAKVSNTQTRRKSDK